MIANYKQQFLTITSWLLIGLIAWLWIQFALQDNDTFERAVSVGNASSRTSLNNGSIEEYHIFGSAQQLYEVPLSQSTTALNFILTGTLSNLDAQTGIAYISNVQGIQQKFRVGDKVFELATLKEIYKTYVVLNHNGKNERLALSDEIQGVTTTSRKKPKSKTTPIFMEHLNGNQQRNWQEMIVEQKFDANKISSIVGNVKLVTNQLGETQGLRISNLTAGNLLTKYGLKSNDIITAINGNRISANNMLSIQETLKNNPNATVTIKRNGKAQNIKINLSDL